MGGGFVPFETGTQNRLPAPAITIKTTQTTVTTRINNKYPEYVYLNNGKVIENDEFTTKGHKAGYKDTRYIYVQKSVEDKAGYYRIEKDYTTIGINPSISYTCTASSIMLTCSYTKGDAKVVEQELKFEDTTYTNVTKQTFTGLNPNSSYKVKYTVTIDYGYYQGYSTSEYLLTQKSAFETQQPKVISEGNVIIQATSNLDEAETNVGFEWRRTDWTDDFASNSGSGHLYEGTMEGYIRNLNTNYLYKYRPYYESNTGTRYYGEWMGIDPTNTSYFEPTVHTYADISVNSNSVTLKGYVQRGTESIATQGFVYWTKSAVGSKSLASRAVSIPSNAKTVMVAISGSNPVLETTLTDLDYETEYAYMTFVTTSENETFYGEERTFTTGDSPTVQQDVTRNGIVDTQDVLQIYEYMRTLTGADFPAEDVNKDGNVDTQDVLDVYDFIRVK